MAFDRLEALGPEKYSSIRNALMRGTPAMHVARLVQGEWGDFEGVSERTLTQQLNRLRLSMVGGAFGQEAADVLKETGKMDLRMMGGKQVDVLSKLVALVAVQEDRVQYLWEKERDMRMPMTGLNQVANDYRDLLIAVQKIQFDLGVDEFRGVIPGYKAQIDVQTLPDGTRQERHLYEAVNTVEAIFKKRNVHVPLTDGNAL